MKCVLLLLLACLLVLSEAKLYEFTTTISKDAVKFSNAATVGNANGKALLTGIIDTSNNLLVMHMTVGETGLYDNLFLSRNGLNGGTQANNVIFYEKGAAIINTADAFTVADPSADLQAAGDGVEFSRRSRPFLWAFTANDGKFSSAANEFVLGAGWSIGAGITRDANNKDVAVMFKSTSVPRSDLCAIIRGYTFVEIDIGADANTRIRGNIEITPSLDPSLSCEQIMELPVWTSDSVIGNRNVDSTIQSNGPRVVLRLDNLRARDPVQ